MSSHSSKPATSCSLLRRAALSSVLALSAVLAAPAAFAEGNSATTMTPPAPNASDSGYQSENSLPESAETATFDLPGANLVTTSTGSTIVTKQVAAGPEQAASRQ